jgi:cytochrome P450
MDVQGACRQKTSGLNSRAVPKYYPLFREETDILLQRLSETPQDFISHFRSNSGAIILKLAYGWTVSESQDPFVRLMEDAFILQSNITKPGKWLVDVFPILRYVPPWFPGAGFRQQAEEFKKKMNKVDVLPFQWAKQQIESGSYLPSFTSQYLVPEDGHQLDEEEQDIIKWCAGALYAGGADTTVAFMTAFVAAMMLHPEAQIRAQREIDDNLGRDPVLKPEDQKSLPYVDALIKEVLRWAPPAPLGLPHRVIGDDIYNGYHIPDGSTIFANIWAICRDESVYHNPLDFNPERFISSDGKAGELDPRKVVFGFGRRICPGALFAESSIFINVVNILKRFKIEKAVNEDGAQITPSLEFTATITSHIKPFPCSIKERSD